MPYAFFCQRMWGRLESGSVKSEDLTAQALDARGLVALYWMKRDLLHHSLHFGLDRIAMGPSTKAVLEDASGSFVVPPAVGPRPLWLDPDDGLGPPSAATSP